MKTQISRDSHRPERRYSGVYQQQGRMLTDADWNELMEVVKRRLDEALTDVVASGAPRERGVEITKPGPAQPPLIGRGQVYADGVVAGVVGTDPGADTFAYGQQADFPSPPSLPADDYRLYADVWERTVVSLEDAELRDPALHGADTTTRTRTMAQVKWCEGAADPEDPAQNPRRGDAPLTLVLRERREERDPCDPCADEVGVAARTGNYLFRLEVHDVDGPLSDPERLTLKWSSENGAEQYAVPAPPGELPPELTAGEWVYEFYSDASESHLGVHLAPSFAPTRGQLEVELPEPLPGLPYVRRWDGYCVLEQTAGSWSLVEGRDGGVDLSETSAEDADGHVDLGADLTAILQALTLTVELENHTFVPGDYWLAPVREAVHETGDTLLGDAPPVGVTHHYVQLAVVDDAGNLEPHPTPEMRRLNFPPLTDLRAGDVGYEPDCASGLFDPLVHDTVERALNEICQITAEHVGFTRPCDTSIYEGTSPETVAEALALLCDIRAEHVSYEAAEACSDLAGVDTVQEALDTLCSRPSGGAGCEVTVGEEGEFPSLGEAIDALLSEGRRDLCLCLMRGDHELAEALTVSGEGRIHLSISGCGGGTRLRLGGALVFDGLASLTLRDLFVDRGETEGVVVERCGDVTVSGVDLVGPGDMEVPLLRIAEAGRVGVSDSLFETHAETALERSRSILGPELERLMADFDRERFFREVIEVGENLARLDPGERQELANGIDQRVREASGTLSTAEFQVYRELSGAIAEEVFVASRLTGLFGSLRMRALAAADASAVFLDLASGGASVEGCEIVGRLQLYGRRPGGELSPDALEALGGMFAEGRVRVETSGPQLQLRGNALTSVGVAGEMLARLRGLLEQQGGALGGLFGTAQYSDNTLIAPRNQLVGGLLNLTANVFHLSEPVGWAVAGSSIYVGNQALDANLRNVSATLQTAANTLGIST